MLAAAGVPTSERLRSARVNSPPAPNFGDKAGDQQTSATWGVSRTSWQLSSARRLPGRAYFLGEDDSGGTIVTGPNAGTAMSRLSTRFAYGSIPAP